MISRFILCVVVGISLLAVQPASSSVPAGLSCKAYLVYDQQAGRVVAFSGADFQNPVASLTKLMTAVLAVERMRFDGRYILTDSERKIYSVDTMRADKLMELMLVPSNNRACQVVARIVSGNETSFVNEMNAKARQFGMYDTRFANASGLPGGEQYSTIGDLLILTRIALTYPRIAKTIGMHSVELGGKHYPSTLKEMYKRHKGLLGGKTGYTKAAGRCLTLYYKANGTEYLVITMKSASVKKGFRDAEIILSYYGLYDGAVGKWDG